MATSYFLRRIVELTDAQTDQEHLDVIVFNRPSIPDRTAYILDSTNPSPLPPIVDAARKLEQLGASCIAIPCITSHALFSAFSAAVRIPFIHILRETASYLKENGVRTAGILATTGTIRASLFQSALAEKGIGCVLPDGLNQERVMSLIYDDYKAGRPLEWENSNPQRLRCANRARNALFWAVQSFRSSSEIGPLAPVYWMPWTYWHRRASNDVESLCAQLVNS